MFGKKPIRVLHIVGGMTRGGVETWLMHVLRNIDREKIAFDFFVNTSAPCAYDEEVESFGSEIFRPSTPSSHYGNMRRLHQVIKNNGPYDVIHSHVYTFSGFTLMIAKWAGVPIRIAHSHTSFSAGNNVSVKHLYSTLAKSLINRYSTIGLAASYEAGLSLYGNKWGRDTRYKVMHCALDFSLFQNYLDKKHLREELGIPSDAHVIGHAGSFTVQKNHAFLIDIAEHAIKTDSNVWFLIVGDGKLRPSIQALAENKKIHNRIVFTGQRTDVPNLMTNVMDAFILPSIREGIPLVLMEAQAAGLPCLISDFISKEIDVVSPLINRFSLRQPPDKWARKLLSMCSYELVDQKHALQLIMNSSFNISNCLQSLLDIYRLTSESSR